MTDQKLDIYDQEFVISQLFGFFGVTNQSWNEQRQLIYQNGYEGAPKHFQAVVKVLDPLVKNYLDSIIEKIEENIEKFNIMEKDPHTHRVEIEKVNKIAQFVKILKTEQSDQSQ